jgi:hypothetical protein
MPTGLEQLDVKVYVDFPQERQNRLGPYVFATDGTQLDSATKVNCIIDPVTLSVMGTPLPMTNEWRDAGTGCTGHYYRYQKSDFTFADATKWKSQDVNKTGNTYIFSGSGVTSDMRSVVQLTSGVARNESLFFSFRKNDQENTDNTALIKLYWANATNKDRDTQLHLNSDGSCDIYRGYIYQSGILTATSGSTNVTGVGTSFVNELSNGTVIYDSYGRLIGTIASRTSATQLTLTSNAARSFTGNYFRTDVTTSGLNIVSGPNKVQTYSRTESNYQKTRPISTTINPNDKFNDVYIIPCRGNELMILTSYGLNFSHAFNDLNLPDPPANTSNYVLDNQASVPIILPSGDFSIQISKGKASFQLAKLYFLANWSIKSQQIETSSNPSRLPTILTGAISCGFGFTAVTGNGTLFTTEVSSGDTIYWYDELNLVGSIELGQVAAVTSDTTLSLTAPANYKLNENSWSKMSPKTGTISFTAGNGAIVGTGTSFLSQVSLLDMLFDEDENLIGIVDSVINNSSMTVTPLPKFSGSSVSFQTNINLYSNRFTNGQAEFFTASDPTSPDSLQLNYYIQDLFGSNDSFTNNNNKFRIKLQQTDVSNASALASTDKGYMFYSLDDVYMLNNAVTPDETTDITAALEGLRIQRSENGDYNLYLDARKQLLEDAGMVNPLVTSNRPVKVTLKPRARTPLPGTISKSGNDIVGAGTGFTAFLSLGDALYTQFGVLLGYVNQIGSGTTCTVATGNTNSYASISYYNEPVTSEIVIFEGYLSSPEINYIQGENYETYALLSFSAFDEKQKLNNIYYSEAPSFDSNNLEKIIYSNILIGGGGNNDPNKNDLIVSPTISTYQVSLNRNNSNGQYNFVANLGDSVGGYIEKIRSDFAQNFVFFTRGDWAPQLYSQNSYLNFNQFKFLDFDYIPAQSPFVSLYLNSESAINDGGLDYWESMHRTIRSMKKTYEKPEANRIYIVGQDKSTGDRIQYLKEDVNSQNPYYPAASRPQNWLGDVAPFVMINDKLNCNTDVVQAANQFYAKLTPGRELIEFTSDLLTYYDFTSKFIPDNREALLGQITCSTGSTSVFGTSTDFTGELAVGDVIYDSDGNTIGVVNQIATSSQLYLINNAGVGHSTAEFYNDYTKYLNQYNYVDIGDVIYVNDLNSNAETYRIMDWDCVFQKETINEDTLNVRTASYRAKKVTIPANNPPEFSFATNSIPANNQWFAVEGELLNFYVSAIVGPLEDVIYSLANYPAGMTIDPNTGEISWTPSGQANTVFSNIEVIAFDGTGSTSYYFTVRVYDNI